MQQIKLRLVFTEVKQKERCDVEERKDGYHLRRRKTAVGFNVYSAAFPRQPQPHASAKTASRFGHASDFSTSNLKFSR